MVHIKASSLLSKLVVAAKCASVVTSLLHTVLMTILKGSLGEPGCPLDFPSSFLSRVRLSVRNVPVSDENGLTYRHSFLTIR